MERSKIPMLSRFDAISHIMPYYGETHRAFLLLSGLCSETREKLDEFYEEFVNHMKEYWMFIDSDRWKKWKTFCLPNDLFGVSIEYFSKGNCIKFFEFIENLRDSKGWYFNSYYMHSKIKIRYPIKVDIYEIKILSAYVDVMKSIQVILCKEVPNCSKFQYESATLDTNCNNALFIFKKTYINLRSFTIFFTNQFKFFKFFKFVLNWIAVLTCQCNNSDKLWL